MKKQWIFLLTVSFFLLAACQTPETSTDPTPTDPPASQPTTAVPTAAPTTAVPPTETTVPTSTPTAVPPTETPTETATALPDPVVIGADTAADGCPIVQLNPVSWQPLFAAYKAGGDPFFHIHTQETGFFFAMELYTVYGSAWTGQLGTFEPNCTTHGICVYLAPLGGAPHLATAGELEIESLSQTGGSLDYPVKLTLRDATFQPYPGSGASGCYHVEEVQIEIEEE